MRLHELDLEIGKKLLLKVIGLDYKSHAFDTQLIGYQKGQSVLLALPSKPGQVLLHQGLKAKVSGEVINARFSFESEIDAVFESPFLYLHLDYPVAVEYQQLRQWVRVPVDTAVEVKAHTGLGMTTGAISGYMLDVSLGGARLVLEKELTAMVTHVSIGVMLSSQGLQRNFTVMAKVRKPARTSDDYPQCGFAYGVEFFDIDEVNKLFLQAFCMQEQFRGRVVPLEK